MWRSPDTNFPFHPEQDPWRDCIRDSPEYLHRGRTGCRDRYSPCSPCPPCPTVATTVTGLPGRQGEASGPGDPLMVPYSATRKKGRPAWVQPVDNSGKGKSAFSRFKDILTNQGPDMFVRLPERGIQFPYNRYDSRGPIAPIWSNFPEFARPPIGARHYWRQKSDGMIEQRRSPFHPKRTGVPKKAYSGVDEMWWAKRNDKRYEPHTRQYVDWRTTLNDFGEPKQNWWNGPRYWAPRDRRADGPDPFDPYHMSPWHRSSTGIYSPTDNLSQRPQFVV